MNFDEKIAVLRRAKEAGYFDDCFRFDVRQEDQPLYWDLLASVLLNSRLKKKARKLLQLPTGIEVAWSGHGIVVKHKATGKVWSL